MTSDQHRIAFYADTHYASDGSTTEYWTPPERLDVEAILLGGDNHCTPQHLAGMIAAIRATQRDETPIVVVPGNGDYIEQELSESQAQTRAAVEGVPNAVFLDNETHVLPSGLRIIGSTLWSHVGDGLIEAYTARLSEFGLRGVDNIRVGDRYLTLEDTNELHLQARRFIESELRELSAVQRRETIVCTHFWPTMQWVDPKDENHAKWRSMCGTDMDDMRFGTSGHGFGYAVICTKRSR